MTIPYLVAPGNVSKAFTAIQLAATPERVSQDFVKTVLKIPGSSGDQMTAFLRRLGFVSSDGAPTELYRQYRNSETAPRAMAQAIRQTYGDLMRRNEYFFQLSEEKLKGLVVEATGEAADSRNVSMMVATLRNLIQLAQFDDSAVRALAKPDAAPLLPDSNREAESKSDKSELQNPSGQVRMNLGYTINLNLPATTDIAVFNAIFKSLREHLLNE